MVERKALLQQGTVDTSSNADRESLRASFELFARMSEDLSSSYQALECQVQELSEELNRVNHEREQQQREKNKMQAKLSGLLDFLPGGVVVIDRWGIVAQANPVACELLDENLVGSRWIDVIAGSFAPKDDDGHEISLRNGRRVSLSTRSLEAEMGQIILLTDQTETRELQRQMARSERLSAMGQMMSALAHQIRTPLSAALLYTGHLRERELSGQQVKEFSTKVASRLQHIEQQIRDMLIFAKGDLPIAERIPLATLFADLQQAAEMHAGKVEFINDVPLQQQLKELACNRQALIGAVMNLIDNAIQASAGNGVVATVIELSAAGHSLVVRVDYHGCGSPVELLQRLYREELFVTSKPNGTGLGLAVARAVVSAHQGRFAIESQEGRGTQIQIELPLVSGVAKSAASLKPSEQCIEY
ncbi:PAS domain-containing sensor histidine kinase [bacterium]|nr:PAS domain-containing sensor histidine kinase [bacterium]